MENTVIHQQEWACFGLTHRSHGKPARIVRDCEKRLYVVNGVLARPGDGPTLERVESSMSDNLYDQQRWVQCNPNYLLRAGQLIGDINHRMHIFSVMDNKYTKIHRDDGPAHIAVCRNAVEHKRQPLTCDIATRAALFGPFPQAMFYLNDNYISYEMYCRIRKFRITAPIVLWTP